MSFLDPNQLSMFLKFLILILLIVFVLNQRVYHTNVTGIINGNIEKVWEKIGKFDKIEWWEIRFSVEGSRGVGQIRYQYPPLLTLKDIQIIDGFFNF
jgi:hypothetical protein